MVIVKTIVLLAVASFAISKQQCYRMGLVADNCDSTEVKVKVVKGSPGARGPVGAPGIKGKPCEASANLFKNLSAMLETKLGKMESSMETKFGKMETKFGKMETKLGKMETKLGKMESSMEGKFGKMEGKFGKMESSIEGKLGKMETKFGKMETKFGKMETKFGKMESSMEGKFGKIQKHLDDLDKHNKTIAKPEADLKKTKEVSKKSTTGVHSCQKILANGKTRNGVYMITGAGTSFKAYCKQGYMVFQRRFDGSTNFNQNFQTYVNGFGSLNGEHWLGLEKLHQFTKSGKHKLRVDLVAYDGATAYAIYDDFSIGVGPGYQLHIGKYSGTAGDSLKWHNSMKFSTPERDNDGTSYENCAEKYKGAFWYRDCYHVNINSFDYKGTGGKGMKWYPFNGNKPVKETTMMVL